MANTDNGEGRFAPTADAAAEKLRLRRLALARRNGLDEAERQEFSRRIARMVASSAVFRQARIIHAYLSFGTEVETGEVIAAGFAAGKIVAVPVVAEGSPELLHAIITPHTRLAPGRYGIPAPQDSALLTAAELGLAASDAILVPVAAFDSARNRLGYGKGYYDRFMSKTAAMHLGLAFVCQEVGAIPTEPHDVRLDAIITETGTLADLM